MRLTALIALMAALFTPVPGAATPPAQDAAATTPAPPSDMAAFARGAKAWADNCSRCHSMRDPKELSDHQWKVATTHMRLRAGMDGQQIRDITIFLQGSN